MVENNRLKTIWTIMNKEICFRGALKTVWIWIWKLISSIILFCLAIIIIMSLIAVLASFSEVASKATNIDKTVWLNVIGAIAASLVGAYAAVYFSLSTQRKIDRKKEQEKINFGIKTIIAFIKPEIILNYNILGLSNSMPSVIFENGTLKTEEYENIKYSLIEYPSEIVSRIASLYEMFNEWNRLPGNRTSDKKTQAINRILNLKKELDILFENIERDIY